MTYPNGGRRDECHPNRRVDRLAFGVQPGFAPWMGGQGQGGDNDNDGDDDGDGDGDD